MSNEGFIILEDGSDDLLLEDPSYFFLTEGSETVTTTAADGFIPAAEERLRDMLSKCTEFQSLVGETSAGDARAHTYYDELPRNNMRADMSLLAANVQIRPFALIWTSEESSCQINDQLGGSGELYFLLEKNTPVTAQSNGQEADRLFKNTLSKILLSEDSTNPGLKELSDARDDLHIIQMSVEQLWRTNEDEYDTIGDAHAAVVRVTWGVTR